jgi:NADPH-dependent 2,4-dienoyl-CoA reductase/sulfur reductase-like enzyme
VAHPQPPRDSPDTLAARAAEAVDAVDVDVDALIVGAGPVGLYTAYYAGFRGRSVAVMDSLPEIGGHGSGRSSSW